MATPIIIAIDGYSSTGKSSFAKKIAKELGYIYVDTGAMYRSVTLFALDKGLISRNNTIDEAGLRILLFGDESPKITFRISGSDGSSYTYLDGKNVEKEIRTLRVSNSVSPIATIPFVREFVNASLRRFGEKKGVVMDGRDIGTAVFPDAELKIFMTASAEVRAERRLKEMIQKGENTDFESVLKNIKERDYIDSHRKADPLRQAEDAILMDNTDMTMEEEMVWIRNILKEKFNWNEGNNR